MHSLYINSASIWSVMNVGKKYASCSSFITTNEIVEAHKAYKNEHKCLVIPNLILKIMFLPNRASFLGVEHLLGCFLRLFELLSFHHHWRIAVLWVIATHKNRMVQSQDSFMKPLCTEICVVNCISPLNFAIVILLSVVKRSSACFVLSLFSAADGLPLRGQSLRSFLLFL